MTATEKDPRPLGLLGTFLLGSGLAGRLLVPESAGLFQSAAPTLFLQAGAAVILLERALRGGSTFSRRLLILFVVLLPGFFPLEARTVARGLDLATAIACGLALRDLVLHDNLRKVILRGLMALGVFLCLLALAQTLYQRQEVEALHRRMVEAGALDPAVVRNPLLLSDSATAFVSSWRASASFANANVFGGFMVLLVPLLLAWAMAARRRWHIPPILVLGVAGFACSGSAGAALSLLLGCGFVLSTRIRPAGPLRLLAALAVIAGILATATIIVLLATGWEPPILADKIVTLRERVQYHLLALRLLPDMGLFGIGLESFGPLSLSLAGPGDSWSHYLHDSLLQLMLECGPFVLLALAPLARMLIRLRHGVSSQEDGEPQPMFARMFLGGIVAGAAGAPLLSPGITLMPLDSRLANVPALNMAVAGGLVALLLVVCGGRTPSPRALAWAVGTATTAFLLHNLVDFDLYGPGAITAFAVVLAIAPGNDPRPFRRSRALFGLSALVILLLPALTGALALDRVQVLHANDPQAQGRDTERAGSMSLSLVTHLADIDRQLMDFIQRSRTHEADALLEDLSPILRERPAVRVAEARYLARRARDARIFAPDALARIEGLRRPGDVVDAEILFHKYRIRKALEDPDALSTAEACLESAAAWDFSPAEAPYLEIVRRALKR